jgi:hypothetical protein
MYALKRRLNHKNPNVQLLALGVCTSWILFGVLYLIIFAVDRHMY